jgi:glutamate synthase (NADPH/NADH) large chain
MEQEKLPFNVLPPSFGLYHAPEERDACGVGFIANFKSEQSHELVSNALTMLSRMDHRGGCGCEPNTGDGAGMMCGMPHGFLADVAQADLGLVLPPPDCYAVGNIFLPQNIEARALWKRRFEEKIKSRGMNVLGWRKVPIDSSMIGKIQSYFLHSLRTKKN